MACDEKVKDGSKVTPSRRGLRVEATRSPFRTTSGKPDIVVVVVVVVIVFGRGSGGGVATERQKDRQAGRDSPVTYVKIEFVII